MINNDFLEDNNNNQNFRLERSSVNSSTGEIHTMKKAFLDILSSTAYPQIIKKIAFYGVIGILIISGIVTAFYFVIRNNFNSVLADFENIVVSANLMGDFS